MLVRCVVVAAFAVGLLCWSVRADAAQGCRETLLVRDTCATGFDINASTRAVDFLAPAGCQINLQREVHAALVSKGYAATMVGPYLGDGDIAAIQCEQRKAGLPVTGLLDRATIRQILGRDLFGERCEAAGLGQDCALAKK